MKLSYSSKYLVYAKEKFYRNQPSNLDKKDSFHFMANIEYECPNLFVYHFNKVNLLADSTLFKGIYPLNLSFPYFKKRLRHHNIKGILNIQRKWNKEKFEQSSFSYLVIHDQWTRNYYHWITQALPRLLLAYKVSSDFHLLLPKDHCSNFHIESLHMLGVKNWTVLPNDLRYYELNNIFYPSHDIQIGDYNDCLMVELASKICERANNPSLRIFIDRVNTRQRIILNSESVYSTLQSYGFKIIDFESLNFKEQLKLAGQTKVLAGVHGAGLTNMLFMPLGSSVFELTTRLQGDQYYYFTLSNSLKHNYFYQLCTPDCSKKSIQEANITVDIDTLKKNIELILNNDD